MTSSRGDTIVIWVLASVLIALALVLAFSMPKLIEQIEHTEFRRNTELFIHEGILADLDIVDYGWVTSKVLLKFEDGKTLFLHIDNKEIEDINLKHRYEITRNALSGELTLKEKH